MGWVDAAVVAAEVVEFATTRDRADEGLVGPCMRADPRLAGTNANTEGPIPFGIGRTGPEPAGFCLENLGPEAVFWRRCYVVNIAMTPPPKPVLLTEAAAMNRAVAVGDGASRLGVHLDLQRRVPYPRMVTAIAGVLRGLHRKVGMARQGLSSHGFGVAVKPCLS